MKLTEFITKDVIIDDLKSSDKVGVLKELVDKLVEVGKIKNGEYALEVLLNREKIGSTGIGDGVAIPHGKMKGLKNVIAAFGRSKKGVDFDALDKKPVHLFFLYLGPEDAPGVHLKILARTTRVIKDAKFREKLKSAKDADEIYKLILEEDEKL